VYSTTLKKIQGSLDKAEMDDLDALSMLAARNEMVKEAAPPPHTIESRQPAISTDLDRPEQNSKETGLNSLE
jgi:hypothetical protein